MQSTRKQDWTEKYRPQTLEDVAGNVQTVKALINFREVGNLPRLRFVGPAGTGKTTSALLLAKTINGENSDWLEINASNERGIDVVRTTIINYAETKCPTGAKFRTIILDEMETQTQPAQMALRREMEIYSENCKFILICNEEWSLIPAIKSRTKAIYWYPLTDANVIKVLTRILKEERIDYKSHQLIKIARDARGDVRYAIETLQTVSEGRDKIDPTILESVTMSTSYEDLEESICSALENNFIRSVRFFNKSSMFVSPKMVIDFLTNEFIKEGESSIFTNNEKLRLAMALGTLNSHSYDKTQIISFLARVAMYRSSQSPDSDSGQSKGVHPPRSD